ncbi:ABC transporter substrate-binding protein [Tropicimonas sp. IMCC34043]|uniref:ABC transporter substrate-binding protein n=1 Tax=Tropicimonas sp. IMCC34043 TaxID=2248760 RepID=UPI000E241057|nr:ABC transporter substrate-binding protein [Tropicimonas sp. IMCC34043]
MRCPPALAAVLTLALAGAGQAAPGRVVSMNLCTDQLAILLAAPGQLVSVSDLSQDPRSSAMVEAARDFPVNHAGAEEVFLLDPDLVLAGTFTARPSVAMLRRLSIPVETMPPAYSLADVRDRIATMGHLLGREAEAQRLVADFDAGLAALRDPAAGRPRAAIYAEQGYTSGPASLAGAILDAAGFENAAAEAGLNVSGFLPLERLVMLDPDMVVLPTRQPGAARAGEVLDHPALEALREAAGTAPLTDADWVCGTPQVLRAIARLAEARKDLGRTP